MDTFKMDQVVMCGVIAACVVFQPEIRSKLKRLRRNVFSLPNQRLNPKIIQAFDQAIQYLSAKKIGALITVERISSLDHIIETGISLDADITGELLINIFITNTPLHDGAVIVRNEKIAAACAYLPLSKNESIPKSFGTRHRAAVGVSEVSDAVTIIVSEETGEVSIAIDNELKSHLTREEYLRILTEELVCTDACSKAILSQLLAPNTGNVTEEPKSC